MHRSSLVRGPLGLFIAMALVALPQLGAARALAQADKPKNNDDKGTKVSFDTVDGVTLQGTFYASARGKDEPTVLVLHKLTGNSHSDGWDNLAAKLNDKGYSVLTFDFRGHGKSNVVDPAKFWSRQYGYNGKFLKALDAKGKPRDAINQKEFPPGYLAYLISDVAAAKAFLDDRNDAGECNSRALIVIGAEDGAALGALWMLSEWNRHPATLNPLFPTRPVKIEPDVEGKDQYAAVWLTMSTSLGGKIAVSRPLRETMTLVGKEKKVPMGFLYGEKDETGKGHAEALLGVIKDPKDKRTLPLTVAQAVSGTKLAGGALLRDGTDDLIVNYLSAVRDKNTPRKWNKTDTDRAYVWTFSRVPIVAKDEKAKLPEPVPLSALGVNP